MEGGGGGSPLYAASHLPLGAWAGRRRRDPVRQDGSGQERNSSVWVDRGRGRREEGAETRDSLGVDDIKWTYGLDKLCKIYIWGVYFLKMLM